ncbi:MAG: FAD-dependent oxidoreductase [Chloroflexi bacterium]|nr:MAG: FAD-dependent oxidoreductase [Chloroflexota bacterium]
MTAEPPPRFVDLPNSLVPVTSAVDVLIVGGGSAGFSAAVAAARNGAEVLLLERFSYIGGLATGGLIILLLTMDDGAGRQAVGGLCQEIVGRMERRNAVYYPPREQWNDPDSKLIDHYSQWGLVWGSPAPGGHRVRYSVAFDAHEFIYAADQMLKEAGVRVLYQTWACEPVVDNGSVKAIVIQNKAGRQAIATKVVIDATGDGDIFAGAGESFELERVHPWLWFEMANVEAAAVPRRGLFFHTPGGGRVLVPWGGEARVNRKIDATDPAEVSAALTDGRDMVMNEAGRLRSTVPGFENATVSLMADQLGITESRRLQGDYVMTREDLDRRFDDVIARTGHWTKYDCVYNIPYRSLLPRSLDNLLVAGRCISVDHRVHHATKEIPPCMATGQAAGTAAALAIQSGDSVKELDVAVLQKQLRAQGAILD